jgi:hypothetical protein
MAMGSRLLEMSGLRKVSRTLCIHHVVFQWCYSGVGYVLQWSYSGVTVVGQWCYSGVTGVTVVLQW